MEIIKVINGKTIVFRHAVVSDAQALVDYIHIVAGETDNLSFGTDDVPITFAAEIEYLKAMETAPSSAHFVAICDHKIIATSNLGTKERPRLAHVASLGISVRKDYWRMGVGFELMEMMIGWAKSTNSIKKINLTVRSDNANAIALYKKCGFTYVGTLHDEIRIGLESVDLDAMELLFHAE